MRDLSIAYGNTPQELWMACGGLEMLTRERLKPLIDQHKKLWVFRNRKGGLDDSASKLEEVYQYYIK